MDKLIGEWKREIVFIDGWEPDLNKPEEYRSYWPTGVLARDMPGLLDTGATVFRWTGDLFQINQSPNHHYGGRIMQLKDGANTYAVHIERRRVPKPRRRLPKGDVWVWRCGRWVGVAASNAEASEMG